MPPSSALGFTNITNNPRHASRARAAAVAEVVPPRGAELPRRLLWRWNVAMACFHTTLAIITLTVGRLDLRVQVYRTGLDFVERNASRGWDLIPLYVPSGTLPFTVVTAVFFALSALFHALNASVWYEFYIRELAACRTPTRWIEYSLSAPTMFLLIAYTLGIRDRSLLIALCVLIGITMPFGYWVEVVARPRSPHEWAAPLAQRLMPWFVGHVPQLTAWGVIVLQFYGAGIDPDDTSPWFVHIILWGEFALFSSFGAASLLSQCLPPERFWRGELLFQVLSLVSKGLLGILLLTNVLVLSRFEDAFA